MNPLQSVLLSILGGSPSAGPQTPPPQQPPPQAGVQPDIPASMNFGANGPQTTPPEDLIASPNPAQPHDPATRMEGYRRLLTDFTYGLGSGLTAASQNPTGQAQRTQAGMGAILTSPLALQKAREAQALQQSQAARDQALAEQSLAQTQINKLLLPSQIQKAAAEAAKSNAQAGQATAKAGSYAFKSTPGGLIDLRDPENPTVVPGSGSQQITITPELVAASGLPQSMIGQTMDSKLLNATVSAVKPDSHIIVSHDPTTNTDRNVIVNAKTGEQTDAGQAKTPTQTAYDQKVAAHNADPNLVARYGAGPNGVAAKEQADAIARGTAIAGAGAAARQDATKSTDPRLALVAPDLQKDVLDQVSKVESSYNQALRANSDLASTVNDASSGNRVAAKYAPVEGVLQLNVGAGVKRINRQEIDQYAGAGSIFDKIKGWFDGATVGQPVPPNILADMKALQQSLTDNAKTLRDNNLQSIDKTYRSTFSVDSSGTPAPSAPPPAGMVRMKTADGKTGLIPAANVDAFIRANPGSVKQ